MNKKIILIFALFFSTPVKTYQRVSQHPKRNIQKKQNIPMEVLFGRAPTSRMSPRLSPDGTKIAYLAPNKGVMNIWIKTIGLDDDRPLTYDSHRGIHQFLWSFDNKRIFYIQDTDGDENWRLYGLSVDTQKITCYTPFTHVQVRIIEYDKNHPERMLIGLNNRDPRYHDIYELNIGTHELVLRKQNSEEIINWIVNDDLMIVGYVKKHAGGENELWCLFQGIWRSYGIWDLEEVGPYPISLSKDGKVLYMIDSRFSDKSQLIALDLETGKSTTIARHEIYDINGQAILDKDSHEIKAISFLKDRISWIFFDKAIEEDFSFIQSLDYGDISIESNDFDDKLWVVSFLKDDGPISYWLYDRKGKEGSFLFDHQDILNDYHLAPMKSISFTARDGLTLHGYLTEPVNKKAPYPLILFVHGGPWARDSWGFDATVQFFANRGWAVLQVNFRGSTGYGKGFMNAANKEWAGAMHNDLVDAVQWAVTENIANPSKIAIFGGSYGGYAALVGATFTPDLFCCAVDIVGPSNLITLIESIPPYWKPELKKLYYRIGNPLTEADFLRSRSPLFKVDAIKIPLLIAQGANDPRVKQSESEQIVKALKAKGIDHHYLLYKDEGHGFVRPTNRMHFMKKAEEFLMKHLSESTLAR